MDEKRDGSQRHRHFKKETPLILPISVIFLFFFLGAKGFAFGSVSSRLGITCALPARQESDRLFPAQPVGHDDVHVVKPARTFLFFDALLFSTCL